MGFRWRSLLRRWLLVGSALTLGCASVKEVEVHSKENVLSLERLFSSEHVPRVEVRESKPYPLLKSSEWVKVWRGSYSEGEGVSEEGWIYIRLKPETPETNF